MRLMDFMNQDVHTITAQEPVINAESKMRLENIRHLVVMSGKDIVGVLSERNIHGLKPAEKERYSVRDVMEDKIVTARPETTIREAANLMRGRTIGSLPVVDQRGKLVGIITTTDLLNLLGQGIERITAETPRRPVFRGSTSRRPPSVNPKLRGKTWT